ncbi:MAG: DUF3082 domain-containing protein [Cyanothece sp. SIO1E1]|nr:DUF3082 domain-containing protein [Cyanothece sp. SIO1E1]
MADPTPAPASIDEIADPGQKKTDKSANLSPLRCFSGAFIAAALSTVLYSLMTAIATTFANKPITSSNVTTLKIAVAVRTLVVGMAALGTGVFALAALGLAGLGIQLLIKQLRGQSTIDDS